MFVCDWTKQLLDDKELVDLTVTGEQRVTVGKFTHDACYRPNIDAGTVAVITNEEFRGTIPSCGDIVCQLVTVMVDNSSESEVAEFQHVAVRDQQILGLDVAVEDLQVGQHETHI